MCMRQPPLEKDAGAQCLEVSDRTGQLFMWHGMLYTVDKLTKHDSKFTKFFHIGRRTATKIKFRLNNNSTHWMISENVLQDVKTAFSQLRAKAHSSPNFIQIFQGTIREYERDLNSPLCTRGRGYLGTTSWVRVFGHRCLGAKSLGAVH